MTGTSAKALETDEGILWFDASSDGNASIGFEAFGISPHLAALPQDRQAAAITEGLRAQARAFDRDAAMASASVAMNLALEPAWRDHRTFLAAIGFSADEADGGDVFTRHSTAVRRTTITVTDDGHVTCRFHGRFPEDDMEILSIGCAATGEAWPSKLDPVPARIAMALELEVAFGDMGYGKGAKARAAMTKGKQKGARR